jgi:hypothetical protein
MSASGQSWKQEVSVPCVRSPVTALTRRMHPLRFGGDSAGPIGCWNADYANRQAPALDLAHIPFWCMELLLNNWRKPSGAARAQT